MREHPIEGLMDTVMNSLREMIDVNTIVGEPVEAANDTLIIPVSKVGFGFAAGGSEFCCETVDGYTKKEKDEEIQYKLPFGGGSGAAVSINPVAFLVVQNGNVKMLTIEHNNTIDKLLEYLPDVMEKVKEVITKNKEQ